MKVEQINPQPSTLNPTHMPTHWFIWFALAFLTTFFITPIIIRLAKAGGVMDKPTGEAKKLHKHPIPLLGGISIYIGVAITVIVLLMTTNELTSGLIGVREYVGFLLGGLVLMVGGYFDDKLTLTPKITIWFPVLAALVAVLFGVGVTKLTNPIGGAPFELTSLVSDVLTFVWLLGMMYTTKFLDGMDGLATGVSAIGAFMVMLLALTVAYFQPDVALLAFVSFGALAGFLIWNFHPASIFLGEGGSTYVGYLLGILAVIGGGKLGTAILVLSIPVLDAGWVILRRMIVEKKSPTKGDKKHLHHRLLDMGLTQRQVVLIYYAIAATVGMATFFLQSNEKIILFGVVAVSMTLLATFVLVSERKKK